MRFFSLHATRKRLLQGVVVAVATPAHARLEMTIAAEPKPDVADVLPALIRVD